MQNVRGVCGRMCLTSDYSSNDTGLQWRAAIGTFRNPYADPTKWNIADPPKWIDTGVFSCFYILMCATKPKAAIDILAIFALFPQNVTSYHA